MEYVLKNQNKGLTNCSTPAIIKTQKRDKQLTGRIDIMKTADEMKKVAQTNNPMVQWCETVLAEKIENAALCGEEYVRVHTDDVPSKLSRSTITRYIQKYMEGFGYCVFAVSNDKYIDIEW